MFTPSLLVGFTLVCTFGAFRLAEESAVLRSALPSGEEGQAPIQGAQVNLDSSPNASLARSFLESQLGSKWSEFPVGAPTSHSPLVPAGVLPYPTLARIDEQNDLGGAAGSTYLVWGLGPLIVYKGNAWSRKFGHNRIKGYISGQEGFHLVKSKHGLNPARLRYSYRILKPQKRKSWGDDDILFTINEDFFGRGFFGIKNEWRIYQGREEDRKMVYYCVRGKYGWKLRCWHSKEEYESGRGSLTISGIPGPKYNPCAVLAQVANTGAFETGAPDQYYLFSNAGEDTALLLSLSILYDSTEDNKNMAKEWAWWLLFGGD